MYDIDRMRKIFARIGHNHNQIHLVGSVILYSFLIYISNQLMSNTIFTEIKHNTIIPLFSLIADVNIKTGYERFLFSSLLLVSILLALLVLQLLLGLLFFS